MQKNIKEQTVFRFDSELVFRMKKAAKLKKVSLNQYVTDLITRDLEDQMKDLNISGHDEIVQNPSYGCRTME